MTLKAVNFNVKTVTMEDIENHKLISQEELSHDLDNVQNFDAETNENSFAGNPFLYHYQFKNLLRCKRADGKNIYDTWNDPIQREKLLEETLQRNRGGATAAGNVFECYRINKGSVVMFKATTAKYLYKKYKAKSVLDPTAGWGGRMLGAWALDIDYTGIDTNIELKPAYDAMIAQLNQHGVIPLFDFGKRSRLVMLWQSCLDVDFSKLDYDFVLTSPPYVNLEIYEHMTEWSSDESFYLGFFIPLFDKCRAHIKAGGHVAFNISPKMYADALKFGLPECDMEEDLKQQMGQKHEALKTGKKKQDKVYIWKC
jgi:DNA modification methylase